MTAKKAAAGFNPADLQICLYALLAVCLLLRLLFVFTTDINWDEFFFLSQVYEYERGQMYGALQTLHVHFFQWLSLISKNEVYQVVCARLVMFLLGLGVLGFIYLICRVYFSALASIAAVVAYCAFSFVGDHATSFRTDPIATFLLMGALVLVVRYRRNWWALAFAGTLVGLAGMITIKAIFYVPIFATILLARLFLSENHKRVFAEGALVAASAILTFGTIFLLHMSSLATPIADGSTQMVVRSMDKTISLDNLFPQGKIFMVAVLGNIVICLGIVAGAWLTARERTRAGTIGLEKKITLLTFALPLLTVVFYRNTFPYYYVFMLAPVCILCAVTFSRLLKTENYSSSMKRIMVIFAAFFVLQLGLAQWGNLARTSSAQKATIDVIHQAFSEPVAYIDRNSMISTFPKKGFFMSSWGFENYLAAGKPIMADIIADSQPKFLLGNIEALDLDNQGIWFDPQNSLQLFGEDTRALSDNYIHHWGIIYVAGKRFDSLSANLETDFRILIEGTYTLEATHSVYLDDKIVEPGNKVFLNRTRHKIRPTREGMKVSLRWGDDLFKPSDPAPETPIYFGF